MTASTTITASVKTGSRKVSTPSSFSAATSAQPNSTPTTRPSNVPWIAMITDSHRITDRS